MSGKIVNKNVMRNNTYYNSASITYYYITPITALQVYWIELYWLVSWNNRLKFTESEQKNYNKEESPFNFLRLRPESTLFVCMGKLTCSIIIAPLCQLHTEWVSYRIDMMLRSSTSWVSNWLYLTCINMNFSNGWLVCWIEWNYTHN